MQVLGLHEFWTYMGFLGLSGFMYRDTSALNAGCVMNNRIRKQGGK